jgi:aspartyl/asparaginyl beta-hydroxylase (cupin superfamily)
LSHYIFFIVKEHKETAKKTIAYKVQYIAIKSVIWIMEHIIMLFIKNESYIDPSQFEWTKTLEKNTEVIRTDFLKLWNEDSADNIDVTVLSEEQIPVVGRKQWYSIPFYMWGAKFMRMHELAPATAKLLEQIPDITTANFSIIKPGAVIKPHVGVINGYIRYHLGVIVPKDPTKCTFKVRGKVYHWREGESMIFDHRHQHEAWNESDETRVVLLVDTIRPLPKFLRYFMIAFTKKIAKSPYIQNMIVHLEGLGHKSKIGYLEFK